MNYEIISSLKNRSKLAKIYYYNPKNSNKTLLVNKANEGTRLILLTKFTKILTSDHQLNLETENMRHRW